MRQNLTIKKYLQGEISTLLKHSGILYAGGLFSIFLTVVQQITTAKFLGPTEYGRLATVLSSTLLMLLLFDFRTWEAATKLLTPYLDNKSSAESTRIMSWLIVVDLIAGLLSTILLIALAQPIASELLKSSDLAWLVRIYALIIPFRLFAAGVPTTIIRLYDYFGWLSAKSITYAVLRLILISGAAFIGFGLPGVVIGAIIGEFLNAIMTLILMLIIRRREIPHARYIDFTPPQVFNAGIKMLPKLWFGATLKGLQLETFIPILALITTPEQVGLFRSGMDITQTLLRLTEPFSIVLQTSIIKLVEQNTRYAVTNFIKQVTILLSFMVLPFVLGILIAGPTILPRLLGSAYSNTVIIVNILLIGFSLNAITLWLRPAIVAFDRIWEQSIIGLILLIVSLIALFLFAPRYKAVGGAMVMSSFLTIYIALSYWLIRRNLQQVEERQTVYDLSS